MINKKSSIFLVGMTLVVISIANFYFTDSEALGDKIPTDVLLEKNEDIWAQKYSSNEEFNKIDKAIRAYVKDTHPSNPWNVETKKNTIQIYNFDARAVEKEAGLHAVLTNVAKQKTNGTYEPTEAEQKFHEWAAQKIPKHLNLDINAKLTKQVIEAYHTNVNHGHVPFDLLNTNSEFWGKVMTDTICELYVNCVSDAVTANTNQPDCAIIPCAEAYHESIYHYLSVSVDPYSCYEQTGCMYTGYSTGTGTLTVSITGEKHANTPKLEYTVNLASNGVNAYLAATGTLTVGVTDDIIDPVAGINSAYVSGLQYVDGTTCGSDHCDTYGFVVESNSYIIH